MVSINYKLILIIKFKKRRFNILYRQFDTVVLHAQYFS